MQTIFYSYDKSYRHLVRNGEVLMIVDPPVQFDGVNYMGGFAWLYGARKSRGIAYCNGMEVNDRGLPRFRSLVTCLAHEWGHSFGALHDDVGATVMHPDGLRVYEEARVNSNALGLPWSEKSKSEIGQFAAVRLSACGAKE
jgi:hypothetical protein